MNSLFKSILGIFIFMFLGLSQAQAQSVSTDITTEGIKKEASKTSIFDEYKWLSKIVNSKKCNGEKVTIFNNQHMSKKYVVIESNGQNVMYDESGELYCTDSSSLDCKDFYKLKATDKAWACGDE